MQLLHERLATIIVCNAAQVMDGRARMVDDGELKMLELFHGKTSSSLMVLLYRIYPTLSKHCLVLHTELGYYGICRSSAYAV